LDYPDADRRYFLIDVEMLAWRNADGSPTTCSYAAPRDPEYCEDSSKTLEVISSEMIETACDAEYYKDYSNNKGQCKKCITSCVFGEFVNNLYCTGYGRDTSNVCSTVVKGAFCPQDITAGAIASSFTTAKQVPDCNGVCKGENVDCPWMYGYVNVRDPWAYVSSQPTSDLTLANDCGYYCGKWRGITRMDNGFPEFIFVPIHPDEPICRLLQGHEIVSQCIVDTDPPTRDFTCMAGSTNDDELFLKGLMFEGGAIPDNTGAESEKAKAVINNLPKSEMCGGVAVMTQYQYNDKRSTEAKSRTFIRPFTPP
jgi:hypothetical protein